MATTPSMGFCGCLPPWVREGEAVPSLTEASQTELTLVPFLHLPLVGQEPWDGPECSYSFVLLRLCLLKL